MNVTDIQTTFVSDTRNRIAIIAGLAVLTLGGNLLALILGAPEELLPLPTLPLTIPIILASYWYPRRGILFSVCFASIYAVTTYFLSPPGPLLAYTIVLRAILLVLIGGVVAFLATKLRESEQEMNQIIEFLPDATFAIDRGGEVIAWNRAIEEMTGVKKVAMLGRGDYEYAVPFYGEPRPLLADRILQGDPEAGYPSVRRSGDVLVAEIYTPLLRGGRGAHIRFAATALLDRSGRVTGAIESIRDVSDEVMTEAALQNAGRQLNILTGILRTDLSNRLAVLYGHLSVGAMKFDDPEILSFIDDLNDAANGIRRQIEISREFRDIGTSPPAWIPVQQAVGKAAASLSFRDTSLDAWTERLEIFADPHLATVFIHLFENSLAPATKASRIVVTYQLRPEGCAIIVEDDGTGIPDAETEDLFVQKAESYGHGLFLAHEILAITGIAIRETGTFGTGAKFEILVPSEGYRIV
ncbi:MULTISPECIES: PAS domain S-box protein [Methanoculleus]|uniref:histidine kinase n=2 Tax=Methanoculleus TaxID=45989 RepID=A3CS20_METMJ|nr:MULTISPECIES: PAS domain S-box protein [Methanoculleus]ABN56170.1 putative PAS/PAC sensor protein [Methanoculleus marisnigri JR1]UYU17638.1 PAS domain S-box protein [Methanoculleus submarinus]